MVENAAATVVDRNDDGIAPLCQRQAAEIVLAAEVAEQGDDAAMYGGQPKCGRDVTVDAAGTPVAVESQGFVAATGSTVEFPDGQRIADEQRRIGRQFG